MHHLYSHALCQLDDDNKPCGYASACVVECRGVRYLLTVSHATGNNGKWAVEIEYNKASSNAKLWGLGGMGYVAALRLKPNGTFSKPKEIDFAYTRLGEGIAAKHQVLNRNGEIVSEEPKRVFSFSDITMPEASESYSFYGLVDPNYYAGNLTRTEAEQVGMRYTGTVNGLHRFQTANPYLSYKEFQGCSGGPIIDSKGRLAALVVEGDKHKTAIMGLDLRPMVAIIDIQDSLANMPA